MNLLLIDDEIALVNPRKIFLMNQGCSVDVAQNDQEAISYLTSNHYNCILLDVLLENTSGYDLCQEIKEISDAPIIFLSNLSDEESQKQGFRSGGDDYIDKQCSFDLFWLKVQKRVAVHSKDDLQAILNFDPLIINIKTRKVILQKQLITLTNLEFDILVLLASSPEKIFSIDEVYTQIWGMETLNQMQTVQVHISRLRNKLEKAFPRHCFLQTTWRKGYCFVPITI